jgi:hypothetical protein
VNPFETETMAEVCLRQGHRDEALGIFRRLLERMAEGPARARIVARVRQLEDQPAATASGGTATSSEVSAAPLPLPGVRARHNGDRLTIEWRLPSRTPAPALEILLVTATEAGVSTERRAIDLDAETGRIELRVPALHSARAAAGTRTPTGFVPLVRHSESSR